MVLQVHLMQELFVAEVTSTIIQMSLPDMPHETFVLGVLFGPPMIGLPGVPVTLKASQRSGGGPDMLLLQRNPSCFRQD
jgi:hypothetical protein